MRFFVLLVCLFPSFAFAQYNLKCNVRSGCPEAIGLIRVGEGSNLKRCTGFLIAADAVVTAGHCLDLSTGTSAAFISRADLPGGAQTRALVSVVYRAFTPNLADATKLSGGPDFAVYKLERPISGLKYLNLAKGPPRNYTTARAFVVNQHVSQGLTIEAMDCQVHRHERFFPFELAEAPDVARFFTCQNEPGFSGAPFFAAGSGDVEAMVNGSQDPPNNLPFPFVPSVEVTNVRCLNFGGASAVACIHPQDTAMQAHFQHVEALALSKLQNWQPFPPQTPFGFTNYVYPTAEPLTYHVAFYPNCRRANWDLRGLNVPAESLRMDFDQWARPKFKVLAVEYSAGQVLARADNAFTVKMQWTPLSEDLSRQLGSTFSVALPPCAR